MKTGKRLWSLLLALILVVSLMGGAFVVNAEDEVMITPTATVGGETVTITVTGLDENFTVFEIYGITEYCLWFDNGTVSFDKDVTLFYQGAAKMELKAGEICNVADVAECYLSLDDSSALMLIDKANPGKFASMAPDKSFSEFPGVVGTVTAEADEPAEEPAEEPA